MPFRIEQALLDTSIYLYPDQPAAERGEHAGGSGFVAGLPHPQIPGAHTLWAVTNKHVIDAGNWTIRLNDRDGGIVCLDSDDTEWFFHPSGDDLAVRPLAVPFAAHVSFVPLIMMLTDQMISIFDVGAGDSTFVIGRFVTMEGTQKNTPSVRFGQIAQAPHEKIRYEKYVQDAWLVEVKSLNGNSGSPVFVHLDPMYFRNGIKPLSKPNESLAAFDHEGAVMGPGRFKTGPFLLGVDCCMIPIWERVRDAKGEANQGGLQVPLNSGMMGVIPAQRLIDMMLANPIKPEIERLSAIQIGNGEDAIPTDV